MQGTMSRAHRRGRPHTARIDNIKMWTGLSVEESIRMREDRDKTEKVRPWCGQPSDQERLNNRTEHKHIHLMALWDYAGQPVPER